MYYFYVLYSLKDGNLYKGVTRDVGDRYLRHNMGGNTSTRHRRPLALIYVQKFETKSDALRFERYTKTLEGGSELHSSLKSLDILNNNGLLNYPRLED